MIVLALDTSCSVISAALSSEKGTEYIEVNAGTRHSELLMGLIDRLFRSAGMESGDLELVACMKGPGSFTGLRIGFSTAKGLSLALGIPLTAIPTLDCMAHNLSIWPGVVLAAIDAKKGRFFSCFYRHGKRISGYFDAEPEKILADFENLRLSPEETLAITGPGAALLIEKIAKNQYSSFVHKDPAFDRGRALELLEIVRKYGIVKDEKGVYAGPLYLRKSEAELNFNL
jgi:tRNA threonylcarbamoyladenosine biosynthesis protein TsaB